MKIKGENEGYSSKFKDLEEKAYNYLRDDFNTVGVVSLIHEALSLFNKNEKEAGSFLKFMGKIGEIFNVFQEDPLEFSRILDQKDLAKIGISEEEILDLIEKRKSLRLEKNYQEADKVRKELLEKGIGLLDVKGETSWEIVR